VTIDCDDFEADSDEIKQLRARIKFIRRRQCVFIAFDLLYLNGKDLRMLPLIERKALLIPLEAYAEKSLEFGEVHNELPFETHSNMANTDIGIRGALIRPAPVTVSRGASSAGRSFDPLFATTNARNGSSRFS